MALKARGDCLTIRIMSLKYVIDDSYHGRRGDGNYAAYLLQLACMFNFFTTKLQL